MSEINELIVTGEGNQVESDVSPKVLKVEVVQTGPQGPPGEIGESAVTSAFGRTGDVTAQSGDYNDTQISVNDDDWAAYGIVGNTVHAIFTSILAGFSATISSILASISTLNNHASNTSNPHNVTKSQVGLGNVDNTSDLNKPISTATQTALDAKLATSLKGAANGLAELDSGGLVPTSQLPSYVDDVIEAANFAALPGTGVTGKIYVTLDDNKTYRWSGSAYVEISASLALGETSSTAYRGDRGKTAYDHSQIVSGNPHNVSKSDLGLSNVDNTSDATKNSATAKLTNKRIQRRVTTITSSATPSINTDDCNCVDITALATNITNMSTNLTGTPDDFDPLIIRIKDNGSARTISWGTSFQSAQATLPTTTTAGKVLLVGFFWNASLGKWRCAASGVEA